MDMMTGDPGSAFPGDGLAGLLDLLDKILSAIGNRPHFAWMGRWHMAGLLTGRSLLVALVGLLLLLILPPLIGWLWRRTGRVEANFRGDKIPQSYGVVILLWAGIMLWWSGYLVPWVRAQNTLWLECVIGFGLLGLVDDVWGVKTIKGLRGHVLALLHQRKLTTGLIKAAGGLLLAGWLAWQVGQEPFGLWPLRALVIALCANTINLLDLRPGRAGAVFLLMSLPLLAAGARTANAGVPPLLYVCVPALVVWQRDAGARVMMGDVGSNLLGGALGLALTAAASPAVLLIALALLVGLHLLAERRSLTLLIEQTPWLRRLDALTGERQPDTGRKI